MENTKVTVVTVTYNTKDILEETILSVINQNYKNIEYIIIDGASTDKTVDIIKKYEDKIDYWISEPDDGIYFAMNKAIEKATGKWINFMNAGDTFFDLDTVKYVMEHKNNDAEFIYGNFQIKETGEIRKAKERSQWHIHMPFCHQTLFTKTVIMQEELFDTSFKLAADHNFIVKMHEEGKIFDYANKVLAIFTLGGFAQSNRFLMNIESLKVLLDNKIPREEINQSAWYKEFSRNACKADKDKIINLEKEIRNKEKTIEDTNSKNETMMNAIQQVMNFPLIKNPIHKYKAYKTMLQIYFELQNIK